MNPHRWAEIEPLFHELLDVAPAARDAWFVERCASDDELERELRSLLAADDATEQHAFLAGSVAERVLELPETDPLVGTTVGAWRILAPIGRGGMGIVYLAERTDGAFRARAAVKVLKRGMDSDEIVRRFELERQTLASLDHPGIARLLDGGTTGDGRPYLVIEHVEGTPITRWCDERRLSVTERVRVLTRTCEAVEAAHRDLVVHRDLKPSNILVTAQGEPKIVDFGIAKVIGGPGAVAITVPSAGTLCTPEYAAPEQRTGGAITAATDVHALGVILYELLTGRRPADLVGLAATADAVETIPPPSAALTRPSVATADEHRTVRPPEPSAVAEARGTDARGLRRAIEGSLDLVVLRAIARDARDRHASAAELAADLHDVLESRPIRSQGRGRRGAGVRRIAAFAAVLLTGAALGLLAATMRPGSLASTRGSTPPSQPPRTTTPLRELAAIQLALIARETGAAHRADLLARLDDLLAEHPETGGWETGHLRRRFAPLETLRPATTRPIRGLVPAGPGRIAVTEEGSATVTVLDAADGAVVSAHRIGSGRGVRIAGTADHDELAIVGVGSDHVVVASAEALDDVDAAMRLIASVEPITAVAWAPDDAAIEPGWRRVAEHAIERPMSPRRDPDGVLHVLRRGTASGDGALLRLEDGAFRPWQRLDMPSGLARAADGTWMVTLDFDGRIDRIDPSTGRRRTWTTLTEPGSDADPVAIAIATEGDSPAWLAPGDAIAVDRGNDNAPRIWRWSAERPEARELLAEADPPFVEPVGVAIDARGVFVADRGGAGPGALFVLDGPGTARRIRTRLPLHRPDAVVVDPADGTLLVAESVHDRILRVDPETGEVGVLADGFEGLTWSSLARGRDGELLVADHAAGRVVELRRVPDAVPGRTDVVRSIVVGGRDGRVERIAVDDGRTLALSPLDEVTSIVDTIDVCPRGKLVAVGHRNGTVRLLDLRSLAPAAPPLRFGKRDSRHRGVAAVAWDRRGSRVVAASGDGSVVALDTQGAVRGTWPGRRRRRAGDVVVPIWMGDDTVMIARAHGVHRWVPVSGGAVDVYDAPAAIRSMIRVGDALIVGDERGAIRRRVVDRWLVDAEGAAPARSVRMLDDGRLVMASDRGVLVAGRSDAWSHRVAGRIGRHAVECAGGPGTIVLSTRRTDDEAAIATYDTVRRRFGMRVIIGDHIVHALVRAPDGRRVAFTDGDGRVGVVDLERGDVVHRARPLARGTWGVRLAWAPDGERILVGASDGRLLVLRADDLSPELRLDVGREACWSLATDPSGRFIAVSATSGVVRLIDAATGRVVRSIDVHRRVAAVGFVDGGRRLLVACGGYEQSSLIVIEPETAMIVADLPLPITPWFALATDETSGSVAVAGIAALVLRGRAPSAATRPDRPGD